MFGFVFGTLCLFGFIKLARGGRHHRRGRCGHGYHGGRGFRGGRGFYDGREGGPRGEGFARAFGEIIKRKLRIDEEQEGLVDHALKDLRASLAELAKVAHDSRAAFANAFREETVDEGALAGVFSQHDEALARARRDVVSALKQIHAVLTPEQRVEAAEWLASGDAPWGL